MQDAVAELDLLTCGDGPSQKNPLYMSTATCQACLICQFIFARPTLSTQIGLCGTVSGDYTLYISPTNTRLDRHICLSIFADFRGNLDNLTDYSGRTTNSGRIASSQRTCLVNPSIRYWMIARQAEEIFDETVVQYCFRPLLSKETTYHPYRPDLAKNSGFQIE